MVDAMVAMQWFRRPVSRKYFRQKKVQVVRCAREALFIAGTSNFYVPEERLPR